MHNLAERKGIMLHHARRAAMAWVGGGGDSEADGWHKSSVALARVGTLVCTSGSLNLQTLSENCFHPLLCSIASTLCCVQSQLSVQTCLVRICGMRPVALYLAGPLSHTPDLEPSTVIVVCGHVVGLEAA